VRLSDLRSLGKISEERLMAVGIRTGEELIEIGPVEAYLRLKGRFTKTTVSWLYALQCAVLDLPYELMTKEMQREWRDEAEEMEALRP
jgi:DNA transformation protein and related proteins